MNGLVLKVGMGKLKDELIKIAGANAIGFDNEDVLKLAKAINYIELQVRISLSDIDDQETKDMLISAFSSICDNTAEILVK